MVPLKHLKPQQVVLAYQRPCQITLMTAPVCAFAIIHSILEMIRPKASEMYTEVSLQCLQCEALP